MPFGIDWLFIIYIQSFYYFFHEGCICGMTLEILNTWGICLWHSHFEHNLNVNFRLSILLLKILRDIITLFIYRIIKVSLILLPCGESSFLYVYSLNHIRLNNIE